jgi:endonuclease G
VAGNSFLSGRTGFDRSFLGIQTPLPKFKPAIAGDALLVNGTAELKYEHFSLAMSSGRRMARWVAWNIDGQQLRPEGEISREGLRFKPDRRLGNDHQLLDDIYYDNELDRGHVARRADVLWGSLTAARRANSDSFFFTNITPQMANFNQSSRHGLWGELENDLLAQVDLTDRRISVFGGPILEASDQAYRGIFVPDEFWKLFVYVLDGKPRAKAFVLKQSLKNLAAAIELPKWEPHEIRIKDLSKRTSLDFGTIAKWEPAQPQGLGEEPGPIQDLASIRW